MSKIWISKLETDLIDHFQPHRSLWDHNDLLYSKIKHKKFILNDLTERLRKRWPQFAKEINPESILKKMNVMKSYYRREVRRINNLKQSGIPTVSSWEHFPRLSFLGDHFVAQPSLKKLNPTSDETKGPTIVSLNHNCKTDENLELDEDSDVFLKWQSSTNFREMLNAEKSHVQNQLFTPSAENIDQVFGHFIISIMKSIPESKKKDEVRMKIIQDLFNCKNS